MKSESCKTTNYLYKALYKPLKTGKQDTKKAEKQEQQYIPEVGDLNKVELICYTDVTNASLNCGSS